MNKLIDLFLVVDRRFSTEKLQTKIWRTKRKIYRVNDEAIHNWNQLINFMLSDWGRQNNQNWRNDLLHTLSFVGNNGEKMEKSFFLSRIYGNQKCITIMNRFVGKRFGINIHCVVVTAPNGFVLQREREGERKKGNTKIFSLKSMVYEYSIANMNINLMRKFYLDINWDKLLLFSVPVADCISVCVS